MSTKQTISDMNLLKFVFTYNLNLKYIRIRVQKPIKHSHVHDQLQRVLHYTIDLSGIMVKPYSNKGTIYFSTRSVID